MSCGHRTRRDARKQDLLRVALRRRAPAQARATLAMPAFKSRPFLCATRVYAETLCFPIVSYKNAFRFYGIQITDGALTCVSTVQLWNDISAKRRAAVHICHLVGTTVNCY